MKQIKTILNNNGAGAEKAACTAMSLPEAAMENLCTTFEGLGYDAIVTALLERWGIYGEPAEGNRNTVLYRLAREMRYICDFSAQRLMAVIPRWGLGEEECRHTIASALASPRGTQLPADVRAVLSALKGEGGDVSAQSSDLNPLPARLPFLLDFLVRRYPRNRRCVLLASLPVLGTLLSRLRSPYLDGATESPIFMTAIIGAQASGKSFLNEMYSLLAEPMLQDDRESMRREQEYKEKVRRAKNSKQQPELETFPVRCLPANVSNTQLLKRADQNGGLSVLSFAPEIDTVVRSCKAGAWAQKSDIYRIGFEAGLYGQDFASENSYSAVVQLRYNLLFSGTDMAMKKFFQNVENGMNSRFCFAQMADDRGEKVQPRQRDEKGMEKARAVVRRLYELGSSGGDGDVVTCSLKRTLKALDQWTDERISEYMETGNEALDILRRRSCLIGFRAGMVAWALEGCKETKAVTDFAQWVATETLQQQMAFFGRELNRQDAENRRIREEGMRELYKTKNMKLFSDLPDEFCKADLAELRRRNGLEGECAYIITGWLKRGLVERVGRGFRKMAVSGEQ